MKKNINSLKRLMGAVLAASLCFVTTACQDIGEGTRLVVDDLKVEMNDTIDKVGDILYYKPKNEEYKPIPYAFCYQVMQDINCYNQPIPDARGRLVGWQGRGEFNIEDAKILPAKTALVRQPMKAPKRTAVEEALVPDQEVVKEAKKVEIVPLEPVFIPEAPEAKPADAKTVTIKVDEPDSDNLY